MSLDKFISSVRSEVAKRFDLKTDAEIDAFFISLEESAKDNHQSLEKRDKMLRDTVAELCEAKRLLRMALCELNNGTCSKFCSTCTKVNTEKCLDYKTKNYRWIHTAEALKLIGEDDNVHT